MAAQRMLNGANVHRCQLAYAQMILEYRDARFEAEGVSSTDSLRRIPPAWLEAAIDTHPPKCRPQADAGTRR